jgi:hypothetical protein
MKKTKRFFRIIALAAVVGLIFASCAALSGVTDSIGNIGGSAPSIGGSAPSIGGSAPSGGGNRAACEGSCDNNSDVRKKCTAIVGDEFEDTNCGWRTARGCSC